MVSRNRPAENDTVGDLRTHPATLSMRSKSPFIKRADKSVQAVSGCKFYIVSGSEKIHRVLLDSITEVEYVDLVSPSCIWVRLLNNICGEYELNAPYAMKKALKFDKNGKMKLESIKEYYYYMAPREIPNNSEDARDSSVVYSRVRILKISKERKEGFLDLFCYAHFIDYGYGAWLNAECLGEMPKDMYTIPWQVIPVALLGVSPSQNFEESSTKWSQAQCRILKKILGKYKRFVAKPCVCKFQLIFDYESYARVELEAIVKRDEELKAIVKRDEELEAIVKRDEELEAIVERDEELETPDNKNERKVSDSSILLEFLFESIVAGAPVYTRTEFDELTSQPLYGVHNEIPERNQNEDLPKVYCSFPDKIAKTAEDLAEEKNEEKAKKLEINVLTASGEYTEEIEALKIQEQQEDLYKWDPEIKNCKTLTHQISRGSLDHMKGEEIFVVLDPKSKKSPYHFYGHVIPASNNISKLHESMLEEFDNLDDWQGELNDFYFNGSNCKRLEGNKIEEQILLGCDVYGIIRIMDKLEQSHFVRVKVVGFTNTDNMGSEISYCFVRLLDVGGIMPINQSTILRLHSKHAHKPALAIQLCLSKIISPHYNKLKSNEFEMSNMLKEMWTLKERDMFRCLTSSETPMKCRLLEIKDGIELIQSNRPAYLSPQTYHIENLTVFSSHEENKSVEEVMVEKGRAEYGNCPEED